MAGDINISMCPYDRARRKASIVLKLVTAWVLVVAAWVYPGYWDTSVNSAGLASPANSVPPSEAAGQAGNPLSPDAKERLALDVAFLDLMQYTGGSPIQALQVMHSKSRGAWGRGVVAGEPAALHLKAWCQMAGIGYEKDRSQALRLFEEAAEAGWGPSMAALAYALEEEGDMRGAIAWLERGVTITDSGCALNLGYLHERGRIPGQAADLDEAYRLYEVSAAAGNPAAIWNRANFHIDGRGSVSRDLAKARSLLAIAAELGHHRAQTKLAEFQGESSSN